MLNQGNAIMRHLAYKYNCEPTEEMSQFTADWVMETIADFWCEPHGMMFFAPDVAPESETQKMTDCLARCSEQLNKKLADGRAHIAGEKVSYADFAILALYDSFMHNVNSSKPEYLERNKKACEGNAHLMKYLESMRAMMKSYLDNRPKCSV